MRFTGVKPFPAEETPPSESLRSRGLSTAGTEPTPSPINSVTTPIEKAALHGGPPRWSPCRCISHVCAKSNCYPKSLLRKRNLKPRPKIQSQRGAEERAEGCWVLPKQSEQRRGSNHKFCGTCKTGAQSNTFLSPALVLRAIPTRRWDRSRTARSCSSCTRAAPERPAVSEWAHLCEQCISSCSDKAGGTRTNTEYIRIPILIHIHM